MCKDFCGYKAKEHKNYCENIIKCRKIESELDEEEISYLAIKLTEISSLEEDKPFMWKWLNSLMSHRDERRQSEQFISLSKRVHQAMEAIGGIKISKSTVENILGILNTNTVCNESGGRMLFPYLSLISHSCTPNSEHWVKDQKVVVRAKTKIGQGQEITIR